MNSLKADTSSSAATAPIAPDMEGSLTENASAAGPAPSSLAASSTERRDRPSAASSMKTACGSLNHAATSTLAMKAAAGDSIRLTSMPVSARKIESPAAPCSMNRHSGAPM